MKKYSLQWLNQPETAIIILKPTKEFCSNALKTMASDKHKELEEPTSQSGRKGASYGIPGAQNASQVACSFQLLQLCCPSFVCPLLRQLCEGRAGVTATKGAPVAARPSSQQVCSTEDAAACAARRNQLRRESCCAPLALHGSRLHKPPTLATEIFHAQHLLLICFWQGFV